MTVYEAIITRRSIRRFKQREVPFALLEKCVDAARLAPSANNRQSLQYVIVDEPPLTEEIFAAVRWAGHLRLGWAPAETERPPAYIVIIADEPIKGHLAYDVGFAAQNILLTAWEQGLGSCCLGSAKVSLVKKALNMPERFNIGLVVALGYPDERPRIVQFAGSVKYWRDDSGVLHVPKKALDMVAHRGAWHAGNKIE